MDNRRKLRVKMPKGSIPVQSPQSTVSYSFEKRVLQSIELTLENKLIEARDNPETKLIEVRDNPKSKLIQEGNNYKAEWIGEQNNR
jgi:hypothetical protein